MVKGWFGKISATPFAICTPAELSRSRACRNLNPGAPHWTGTTHSERGGSTIILATRTLVDGGNSFGGVGCAATGCRSESWRIGITLSLASATRLALGIMACTCQSMNWQPRIHSAARPCTTMKRACTLSDLSCTVSVIFPFCRSLRPPAPTI
jgi:hypothetical protein